MPDLHNALEVLGGWGWATRNRDQFKLLLDGFLAYAPGEWPYI